MGKYNIWVSPAADILSKRIMGDADRVRASADQFKTHSKLTDIGEGELDAIAGGRFGDTLMGGALKSQAARANEGLKNSYGLGATALARNGSSNSGVVYQKMLDKAQRRNDESAMDKLATALPGYTRTAGIFADTDNQLLERQNRILAGASDLDSNAYRVQSNGTRIEKKKSIWDKIGAGAKLAAGIAGAFMNPAAGISGGLKGIFDGGGGGLFGDKYVDASLRSTSSYPGVGGDAEGAENVAA